MLPQHRRVLTTHRDQIAEAVGGVPATAQVRSRARTYRADLHIRVRGKEPTLIRSRTTDGAVQFVLADGAGTVTWTKDQVRVFLKAKATGRWPSTPLQGQRGTDYKAKANDPGYVHVASANRSTLRYLLMSAVTGLLAAEQYSFVSHAKTSLPQTTEIAGVGLMVIFTMACLSAALIALHQAKHTMRMREARRILRDPALPVTPMLMLSCLQRRRFATVGGEQEVREPWALLWYKNTRLTPPVQDGPHGYDSNWVDMQVRPVLSVPLLFLYSADINARERLRDADGPQLVEVIGTLAPGKWLAIRTEEGIIWPRDKAK